MHYADIKKADIANGLGVRVSVFVSGCTHHCKNCFNSEAWDFNYGNEFTENEINRVIKELDHSYVSGLSVLTCKSTRIITTFKESKRKISRQKHLVLFRLYL